MQFYTQGKKGLSSNSLLRYKSSVGISPKTWTSWLAYKKKKTIPKALCVCVHTVCVLCMQWGRRVAAVQLNFPPKAALHPLFQTERLETLACYLHQTPPGVAKIHQNRQVTKQKQK